MMRRKRDFVFAELEFILHLPKLEISFEAQ